MGPAGANVFKIQDARTYGLDGLAPDGTKIYLGQHEPGEPFEGHTMLPDSAVTVRGMGTAVHTQAVTLAQVVLNDPANKPYATAGGSTTNGDAAAGDLFKSRRFGKFGAYPADRLIPVFNKAPANELWGNGTTIGLQQPEDHGNPISNDREDDLDAVEVDDILDYVAPDGDGMHNQPIFFTLDPWSPSISATVNTSDILVSLKSDPSASFSFQTTTRSFDVFADHTRIGLDVDDVIDALVMSDVTVNGGTVINLPNGILEIAHDEALFSVAPGSPLLNMPVPGMGRDYSPADVLYTRFDGSFQMYAPFEMLGLDANDNLNALDIFRVPEPMGITLLGFGGMASLRRRRRLS